MSEHYWTRPWMKRDAGGFERHNREDILSGLCSGCGLCVSVCPTKGISMIRAEPEPQLTGSCRATAEILPKHCGAECPAGIDVSRFNRLIALGRYDDALATVRRAVPFAGIMCRICTAPCETTCYQGVQKDPIAVRLLKKFVVQHASFHDQPSRPATNKKAAVVGSGPAGLTAAYYLAKKGHGVTVFEALSQPGGMLRVGIPEFRLPRNVLDAEIDLVRKAGVEIRTGARVESVDALFAQGYDAAFLATGAHRSVKLGVPGEDHARVIDDITFLRKVGLGERPAMKGTVAVVGGGNSAVDSARTARRLGADCVTLMYRRTRTEMPAYAEEIDHAIEEGVELKLLTTITEIKPRGDRLQLVCQRMQLGDRDASGRRRPAPIHGSEFTVDVDFLIVAIGQAPEFPAAFAVRTGANGGIDVHQDTLETSRAGVFAAGDAVVGAASVIDAVAGAKKAASAIDRFLGGDGVLPVDAPEPTLRGVPPNVSANARKRVEAPFLPAERRNGFDEVELGFTEAMARAEAERCWGCGECSECSDACPGSYIPLTELEQMVFGRTKTHEELQLGIYRNLYAGYTLIPEIRKAGVAGGVVTGLLAYGLETGKLDCAIVAGWDENEPWKVKPRIATTRQELMECSRSKYSVSQSLSVLGEAVEMGFTRIGVVGLPCYVVGIRKMQLHKQKMAEKIALTIGLYCLSQTYIEGTEYMIRDRFGIPLEEVEKFAFRAEPYPGYMTAWSKNGEVGRCELMALWGMAPTVFIGFRLERCLVCQEHLSELADISCGDVWGRTDLQAEAVKEKVGHTEIFTRTERGQGFFDAAVAAGYIQKMDGSPAEFPIDKHYVINPGWFKRVASDARIKHRTKYGWPVPKIE